VRPVPGILDTVSLVGAVNNVAEPCPLLVVLPCDRVNGWGWEAISVVVPGLVQDVAGKCAAVEVSGLLYVTDCVRAGNT